MKQMLRQSIKPLETRQRRRSKFDELYKQLNQEQKQAVDAIEGPVMVMAGPGTGKTQVLTMRIANILRQTDMEAGSILCLTFTESAAAAMRERLLDIIGTDAYRVRIGTFHSFCNDIIQEHPDKFALAREWQPLTEAERIELVRSLIDQLPGTSALKPWGSPYLFLSDIVQSLQWLKKEGVTEGELKKLIHSGQVFERETAKLIGGLGQLKPAERTEEVTRALIEKLKALRSKTKAGVAVWALAEEIVKEYEVEAQRAENKREAGKARTLFKNKLKKLGEGIHKQGPRQTDLLKIYHGYQAKLKKMGRYDFEDMIMQVVTALKRDDELLAWCQERWQYILVDEYQDTNGAQNEVVNLISNWHEAPNVFVVGDDKQSIFRFQGASLENLLSFWQRHRDQIKVVSLKNNYRSQQLVLDAASQLIAHNRETVARYVPGIKIELTAASGRLAKAVELTKYVTESEESYQVACQIKKLIKQGVPPAEISVLGRYNRDVEEMGEMLAKVGVKVRLETGINVLHEFRVRQFKRLLEWVVDVQQEEVLAEIMQYDWWKFKPLDVLRVIYFAGHERQGIWPVISNIQKLQQAEVEQPEKFVTWAEQVAKWKNRAANQPLLQVFDELLNDTGLLVQISQEADGLQAVKALSVLFSELRRMSEAKHDLTWKEFTDRLNLMAESNLALTAEARPAGASAVRLMTAHKAKGLEFEHVFIVKLVDKHWGNQRSRTKLVLPAGIVQYDPVIDQENNEDERRLFYVALTRAKQQLHWSYAQVDISGREQVLSQFVSEIKSDLIRQTNWSEDDEQMRERLLMTRAKKATGLNKDDIKDWATEQLKKYVMSVTHLNHYLECPRLFYYRNFLRVPAAKNKHMAFGTAVHGALYDLWQLARINRQKASEDFLWESFKRRMDQEVLKPDERQDSLVLGENVLRQYYRHYGVTEGVKVELEYSFRRHGITVGELPITGQLDKIEYLSNDQVKVVDYKTGNPDSAYTESRPGGKYYRQLVFYKLLCDESRRFKYEMVSGELDFIQPSARRGKLVRLNYAVSANEVDKLKETIEQVWEEMKALKFLEEEVGCGKCEYCDLTA